MPTRRSPYLGASNQPGGGTSPIEQATSMPQRPSMPMSPGGGSAAGPTGSPMGSMGAMSGGGGQQQPGMPTMEPRLPIQPAAGGPTSPMNIDSMVAPRLTPPTTMGATQANAGAGGGPQALPAFGDSQGSSAFRQTAPAMATGSSAGPQRLGLGGAASGAQGMGMPGVPSMPITPPVPGTGPSELGGEGGGQEPGGALTFLKMLKAMGQI